MCTDLQRYQYCKAQSEDTAGVDTSSYQNTTPFQGLTKILSLTNVSQYRTKDII